MCVWIKLSDFGEKHIRLLNTSYVKELVSNNILYVHPEDIHRELMSSNMYDYTMKGIVDCKYISKNIGRVRSIDVNRKSIEVDVNPECKDYIGNMKNPRISFLAYTGLNKTGPVFYIQDEKENTIEEGDAV